MIDSHIHLDSRGREELTMMATAGITAVVTLTYYPHINLPITSQTIKDYFDRVFDIHIKDVTAANPDGGTCIIGRGVIDIVSFLKTVIDLNYTGTLALEYEADKEDPLPGMMESLGYVKGVLATI